MAAEALPEPQSMRMESVGSHAFKKLGAVAISAYLDPAAPSLHYESAASFASQSLPVSRSLLASSGDSGWMFLVAPGLAADPTGQSHGLLYARSAAICAAIEEDVAAQEEEAKDKGEEGPSKKSDLPLSDKLFRFMRVEGAIWHISFNRTNDFLCVCTLTHILMYSLHSIVAGDEEPFAALEMDQPMRDVAWSSSAHNLEIGVLLVTGVFRVYEIKLDVGSLQCTQQFNGPPVTAIVSGGPHPMVQNFRAWFLGFADGSLQMLDPTSFPRNPLLFPPHLPPDAAEGENWGIHSLSYLPLSADPRDEQGRLVVGYSVPQAGDDFGERDPTRVHVSVLNTDSLEWFDYGDVLRDEEKCNVNDEADRLYEGRHRFHVSPIPDLSLAVFGSSKAAEVTVLGVLPEENPAQHPVNWWFFDVEADQIVVPMDSEFRDTYALGFAIDTTNRVAPDGPSATAAASSSSGASNAGLFPAVFMLSTNARLHVYHLTTSDATHLNRIRGLMRPAIDVPPLAESVKQHQFFSTMLPPSPADGEQEQAPQAAEEGQESGGDEATQPPSPDSATPPFTPPAAPQPKAVPPAAAAIPTLPPAAAAAAAPGFDFAKSAGAGFDFGAPKFGATTVLPDAAPTFGGFNWAPAPVAAAAAPPAAAPKPAVTAPPVVAPAPAAKPAPVAEAASMPPPIARTARKTIDFAAAATPSVSASPVLSAKGSPTNFEPAPLQGEIPPAARSGLPQPTATGSMTRSIIKPVAAAAAAATPSPPADPFAPSNFGIDYSGSSSAASAEAPELSARAKKATAVDYKSLKHADDVGTDTEKKFMEALMTVAINFKHVTNLAHQSREAIVAAQSAPAKPAPGHEADFSLKSLRTLTSRTRTLMSVASHLQESEQKSSAALQELVDQSHRDKKIAATCESLLKREQDPDYQELLQSMTLDVHSARMQQSIDTTTTHVNQQIAALETHLHDLYTLHHASTGAPASLVSVPSISGVAGVVNKHGRSIDELEDLVDELSKQVEHLQANPPPLSREQRRAKREKQRESGLDHLGASFSPMGRNNSAVSELATPETKEEKEDAFSVTSTPKRSGTTTGTPSRSASSATSFRPSSLSALNDSFQSKLKRSGAVKPSLNLRPSLSREASIAAISRGKSKQRLDQLFAAVDTPGLQNISPLQPEEELQESRMDSGASNTRRWARSGGERAGAVSPVPLREVTSSDSDDSDDDQPLVLNVTAPVAAKTAPMPAPIKLSEVVGGAKPPLATTTGAAAPAAAAKPAAFGFGAPAAFGAGLPAPTISFGGDFALPAASPLFGTGAASAFPAVNAFSGVADAAPVAGAAAAPATELKPKAKAKEKPKLVLGEAVPDAAAATAALPPPIAGLKPAAATTPAPAPAFGFGTGFAGFGSFAPLPAAAAGADADDSKLPPPAALIAKKPTPTEVKPAEVKPAAEKPVVAAAPAAAPKPVEKVAIPAAAPAVAAELPKMSAAAAIAAAAAAAPPKKDAPPAQSDAEAAQLKNVLSLLGPSGERDAAPSPEPGAAVASPAPAAAVAPAEKPKEAAPAAAAAAAPAPAPLVFPSLSLPAAAPLVKPAAAPVLDLAAAAPAPAAAAAAAPAAAPFSLGAPASFGFDFAKALPGTAASSSAAAASSTALPTSSPSMAISATPLASPFAPTPAAAAVTTPSASTNLFGPGSAPVTGGLFGSLSFGGAGAAAAPAAANTGANLFAMPPSTAGVGGGGGMGLFGSSATSLLPPSATAAPAIGGGANLFSTPPSGNIFGGGAAAAPASSNPFAPASGFPPSGMGASGFPAPAAGGAGSSLFAPATNLFAPAPGGLSLGNNPFAPAASAGGAPGGSSFTSNVFGNTSANQPAQSNNPFGTGSQGGPFAQQAAQPSGPFGAPAQPQQQPAPASNNPFGGSSNPLGVGFGQQSFGVQGPSNSVAALAFGGGPGGIGSVAPSFGGGAAATGAVFGGGGGAAQQPVFGTSSFGGGGGSAAQPAFGSGGNVFGGGGGGAPQSSPFGALAAGGGGGFPQPAASGANLFGGSGFPAASGFPSAGGAGGFPNFANQGFRG